MQPNSKATITLDDLLKERAELKDEIAFLRTMNTDLLKNLKEAIAQLENWPIADKWVIKDGRAAIARAKGLVYYDQPAEQ